MLYETLSQPSLLLAIVAVGFLCGIVFDLANVIFLLCEKNRVVRIILDVIATLFVGGIFFLLILKISFGEVRLWQILFFSMAVTLERETISKLVAKFFIKCYNFFVKILKNCLKNRAFTSKKGKNE